MECLREIIEQIYTSFQKRTENIINGMRFERWGGVMEIKEGAGGIHTYMSLA